MLLPADEAHKKSLENDVTAMLVDEIEKQIVSAIDKGEFVAYIYYDLYANIDFGRIRDLLDENEYMYKIEPEETCITILW